jgi:alpha-L-fucosidase
MPNFTGDDYDVGRAPATTYNPTHLDVRQWIRVAHDLGAKYAILVAKYMSGFCLWPAKAYDYTVANSGNKTDVVRAFVEACNEFGLKSGFYYCILDPRNEGTFEKFSWDSLISDQYFDLIKRQIAELHTLYPNTFYQLFDIPWKLKPEQRWELYRLVKQHNPRLRNRQQPGLQTKPCESGTHLRGCQLALRRHQRRRYASAARRARSTHHL